MKPKRKTELKKKIKTPKIENYVCNLWGGGGKGRTVGYVLVKARGGYSLGEHRVDWDDPNPKLFLRVHKIMKGRTRVTDKKTVAKVRRILKHK